jgi:hypothetical protein
LLSILARAGVLPACARLPFQITINTIFLQAA